MAFVDTRAFQADRLHELETAILQRELHQSAVTDKLIDQFMTALLQRAPFAARVRLGVVHDGITGLTGTALLRVDITNGVASAGHAAGTFTVNQPLSEWNDFLPTLLAGKCAFQRYGDDLSVTLRARLVALGAGSFLACPVIDVEQVLGATVGHLERDPPPMSKDLRSLIEDRPEHLRADRRRTRPARPTSLAIGAACRRLMQHRSNRPTTTPRTGQHG